MTYWLTAELEVQLDANISLTAPHTVRPRFLIGLELNIVDQRHEGRGTHLFNQQADHRTVNVPAFSLVFALVSISDLHAERPDRGVVDLTRRKRLQDE